MPDKLSKVLPIGFIEELQKQTIAFQSDIDKEIIERRKLDIERTKRLNKIRQKINERYTR